MLQKTNIVFTKSRFDRMKEKIENVVSKKLESTKSTRKNKSAPAENSTYSVQTIPKRMAKLPIINNNSSCNDVIQNKSVCNIEKKMLFYKNGRKKTKLCV